MDLTAQLIVEDHLPKKSPEESPVNQIGYSERQIGWDIVGDAGSSEKIEFIDPVVSHKAEDDHKHASWNEVSVKIGKPHQLYDLSVSFTNTVLVICHQLIRFALGYFHTSLFLISLADVHQLIGVTQPDERNQNWWEYEHQRFLLNDTERMAVVVVVYQGLNSNRHKAGGEEHA